MKKTNQANPLAFFNNANQARQNVVKKSLKKAQDGIQTNGDPEDMMINKPGYGAKKTRNPLAPYAGMMDPTRAMQELSRTASNVANMNAANNSGALNARSAAVRIPSRDNQLENYGVSPYKQKRGGAVKTKKRK